MAFAGNATSLNCRAVSNHTKTTPMIELLEEKIIKGENCYTSIQYLATDSFHSETSDFLIEIIKSKFHFWQGDKHPNGMTWSWSENNIPSVHPGIKTFGFYDNNKIVSDHYKKIDFLIFETSIASYIFDVTQDNEYENKIKDTIQEYKTLNLIIFKFAPDNKLEKSKFSVYSSFIAFLLVDKELKKAIRLEFGED
jgi:hypothetical protein